MLRTQMVKTPDRDVWMEILFYRQRLKMARAAHQPSHIEKSFDYRENNFPVTVTGNVRADKIAGNMAGQCTPHQIDLWNQPDWRIFYKEREITGNIGKALNNIAQVRYAKMYLYRHQTGPQG